MKTKRVPLYRVTIAETGGDGNKRNHHSVDVAADDLAGASEIAKAVAKDGQSIERIMQVGEVVVIDWNHDGSAAA